MYNKDYQIVDSEKVDRANNLLKEIEENYILGKALFNLICNNYDLLAEFESVVKSRESNETDALIKDKMSKIRSVIELVRGWLASEFNRLIKDGSHQIYLDSLTIKEQQNLLMVFESGTCTETLCNFAEKRRIVALITSSIQVRQEENSIWYDRHVKIEDGVEAFYPL